MDVCQKAPSQNGSRSQAEFHRVLFWDHYSTWSEYICRWCKGYEVKSMEDFMDLEEPQSLPDTGMIKIKSSGLKSSLIRVYSQWYHLSISDAQSLKGMVTAKVSTCPSLHYMPALLIPFHAFLHHFSPSSTLLLYFPMPQMIFHLC